MTKSRITKRNRAVASPAKRGTGASPKGALNGKTTAPVAPKRTPEPLASIDRLEADLWEAADQLRANSKLTSSEYCMPVLGVIFLRHAANRYEDAKRQIEADQAAGRMPKRRITQADYLRRRALLLPEEARYDTLLALPRDKDLGHALINAMTAIENDYQHLSNVLPKDYTIFERNVLEDLLRIFNREALRTASGDVFGRIYEYFLMKFAMQGAQDNGEFFTPPSIVQTIVNVIEPEHGNVFDPACGSGGMFVQSSHFIEETLHQDTAKRVVFHGQEKTATTIKLAKMNLAVHGLEGNIREANTFYEDVHTLVGKCDFVMANPPFNVDMVDAEKVKDDRRLPFGLPGVNKQKKVSNANYLWISYFHSYLNPRGRAGFVMSSQASSAGHGEKEVRRKIVQSGDVDVMIAIRSNFFYTRTVPCELWFFDKGKPKGRRDKVLMLDARNIYRKVNRKINDFSPEQLSNIAAITWLYRGQEDRFLDLVKRYIASICSECEAIAPMVAEFDAAVETLVKPLATFARSLKSIASIDKGRRAALDEAIAELTAAIAACKADRDKLLKDINRFREKTAKSPPTTNKAQHAARRSFDPIAERIKGLIKQADLIYKLAGRAVDVIPSLFQQPDDNGKAAQGQNGSSEFNLRGVRRLLKSLDEHRRAAVEQLKRAAYFHKQVCWLQDRFPGAVLCDVPGLVKLVSLEEIEQADWSLTPGRYVGVAPPEEDEDFDFEQQLRDIHIELAGLNEEAVELAQRIQANFEELGI